MISRRTIALLLAGFAILIVAFAVLMAFYALLQMLGDTPGATVLLWTAVGCGILTIVDLVLLVAALGIRVADAVDDPPRRGNPDEET